jgi:hypothetical protein
MVGYAFIKRSLFHPGNEGNPIPIKRQNKRVAEKFVLRQPNRRKSKACRIIHCRLTAGMDGLALKRGAQSREQSYTESFG